MMQNVEHTLYAVGRIPQVMTNDSETRSCEISRQEPDLTKLLYPVVMMLGADINHSH
jgi:hypothetical protein